MYEVNVVICASPSNYSALLAFYDRRGQLHERQIRNARKATKNSNVLQAVTDTFEALQNPCIVNIYTDSEYLVEPVRQKWIHTWEQNGWINAKKKPIANAEQWKRLRGLEIEKQLVVNYVYNEKEKKGEE